MHKYNVSMNNCFFSFTAELNGYLWPENAKNFTIWNFTD